MQMTRQEMPAIRVFLIETHRILLWGLQQLITSHAPQMQLVGSAASSIEALGMFDAALPDIVLLDLDGEAQAIPQLVAASQARLLCMTRFDDKTAQDKAILDGARGILDKQATPETFLEAIAKVHEGQLWLDRAATGRVFIELSRRETARHADPEQSKIDSLTEREKRIVAFIFENTGSSARTLSEKLHISESTLRNHLTSIYGKLGIANRFELISYALKHDFLLTLHKIDS